jgi:hypothetical protein
MGLASVCRPVQNGLRCALLWRCRTTLDTWPNAVRQKNIALENVLSALGNQVVIPS